jgi:hypothetical protein
MTDQPAAPARADFGKRDRLPMGREIADPEKELRIFYNLEMRQFEDDPSLWLDKARSMADPWLTKHSIVFAPDRGKIIMGVQGLKHDHTQDGFIEFMRDIKREYEATKELAAKVNGKPSSPFGPKPLSPEVQKKLEEDKVKTMEQIAERERQKQAEMQSVLANAADDPNPTPSPDVVTGEIAIPAKELSELDKAFGPKPEKHFSEDGEWWKKTDKLFRKYREAAVIEHRRTAICEWLKLDFIKDWDVTPEAALAVISDELDARFGAKGKIAPPQTAPKSVVPTYAPKPGANDSVGSGQPETKNEAPVAPKNVQETTLEKSAVTKDEIRKKYNQPQRGKDYLVVQGRILIFRLDHPDWTIETEHIILTEDTAVFKAIVRNHEGRIVGTGHGRATEAGTKNLGGRYIEKAETSAIGRALAISGYGTDDSLDDSDYLSDSPVKAA